MTVGIPHSPADVERHVGQRIARVEDVRFLTGSARYVGDVELPRMLHAAFLRSPLAHAIVRDVDLQAAARHEAVVDVVSARELAIERPIRADTDLPGWQGSAHWPLAVDRVRFVGEPIAAVVAGTRYAAEDGVDLVTLDLEELPAVATIDEAIAADAPRIHEDWDDNYFLKRTFDSGDVDGAFAAAAGTVALTTVMGRHSGVPLETRGCVADYDASTERLTLYSSHQMPHFLRTSIADMIGLPEHRLRVVCPDVGGGFGIKSCLYPEEIVVCLLAIRLRRPVKWIEDRREHMLAAAQARDHRHEVEAAYSETGEILGLRARIFVDAGAYSLFPWTAALEPGSALANLPGPYRIRNYRAEAYAVSTTKCPAGPYRGVARVPACLTTERLVDEIARRLDLDPLEVRRRNLVQPDEFPYVSVTGSVYDSGSYTESLDELERLADVPGLRRWQRAERVAGRHVGIGFACFTEQGAHGVADYANRMVPSIFAHDTAVVRMSPSGHATILVGVNSHGQGLETTLAQIAADQLGLAVDDVRVMMGDTDTCPYGGGTFGSRALVVAGGAVHRAAGEVGVRLRAAAAALLECEADELELTGGCATSPMRAGVSISVADVARTIILRPHLLPEGWDTKLEATVSYAVDGRGPFSNAAHAAVVSVDAETGLVRVLRYFVVGDCGTLINPLIVDGQTYGAVAQGIGGALFEHFSYDDAANPLSTTFLDYLLPNATDIPEIVVKHLETPSPVSENGTKGVGESGTIGAPAAIANAVADAIAPFGQVIVCETPLVPERVLGYIDAARLTRS
jgi:carbon-monoxide dehydrogenase large subunit